MQVTSNQLKLLFQAFREDNENTFYRTAENIIAGELASNHHSLAGELKKSLGNSKKVTQNNSQTTKLNQMPKDRRYGEELVILKESNVDQTKIILGEETKSKIERIVIEHKKRNDLGKYGFYPKNKLLFWGPPGCGKTYTAHYLAYELGLPIGTVRLNAIISSFLGDTTSHLQRVFDLANSKPMVLLLDEIDAIGKNRDDNNDVGELKRVVNGLLQAMDFFESTRSVIIAASNHQYLLDSALFRRFDDTVHFPIPSLCDREKYLKLLLSGVNHNKTLVNTVKSMNSFSFADVEKVTIESLKTMILSGRSSLTKNDLVEQIEIYHNNLLAKRNNSK